MSTCHRFEEEGLEAETLSEEFNKHLQACKDCQQAQKSYESLFQLFQQRHPPVCMPAGWKENVWRAIGPAQATATPAPKQPELSFRERWQRLLQSYRWVLGGVATAAALLGVGFFSMDMHKSATTETSAPLAFEWSLRDATSSHVRSMDSAKLGNHIHIKAQVPPASQAALFVYLQNRLVFSCSQETPGELCQQVDNVLKAQIPLEQLGLYRALWVISSGPLSAPQEGFDLDAAAFLRAGANIQHPFAIEVY